MKKTLIAATMLLGTFSVQAEVVSQLLTQGVKGIDTLVNRMALQQNYTADEIKQISTSIQTALKILNNGQLPSSSASLATILGKDLLNEDASKISPTKLFDMINSASVKAKNMGMIGSDNVVSCQESCISKRLHADGLSASLSTSGVSGSAKSFLATKDYIKGMRVLGAKFSLSARESDAILAARVSENEKAQLVNAMGLMTDGTEAQRTLGATIKSFKSDIQTEILTDLDVHTVVFKADNPRVIYGINNALRAVRDMNPTTADDFSSKLGTFFKTKLKDKPQAIETMKSLNCYRLGTLISRAK